MNDVKQVIVIRRDLKMRRGKECAQAGHAATAWLTELFHFHGASAMARLSDVELMWLNGSEKKVVCQVDSKDELWDLHNRARVAGLKSVIVTDAGYTEFGGVPTDTVLAIGPDFDDKIDTITRHLKLY